MGIDKDEERHSEIVEHEEVSAHPGKSVREQELEAHHGHPPASHDNLAAPVILAALVAFFALYGLAMAGNTKLDIKLGQEAYDSVHKRPAEVQEQIPQEKTVSPVEGIPEGFETEDSHDHGHGEEEHHDH